jgi:hypothetical protein
MSLDLSVDTFRVYELENALRLNPTYTFNDKAAINNAAAPFDP